MTKYRRRFRGADGASHHRSGIYEQHQPAPCAGSPRGRQRKQGKDTVSVHDVP